MRYFKLFVTRFCWKVSVNAIRRVINAVIHFKAENWEYDQWCIILILFKAEYSNTIIPDVTHCLLKWEELYCNYSSSIIDVWSGNVEGFLLWTEKLIIHVYESTLKIVHKHGAKNILFKWSSIMTGWLQSAPSDVMIS